jgi:ubiquinone/menaquinone biosynthesis C-methylase UbiE
MKILLHIGWHKTGSTAIQQFLHANRDAILKRTGILYPLSGIHTVAHHLAAWSLHEPLNNPWAKEIGFNGTPEEVFGAIFEEARQTRAKAIILSSEVFCSTSRYRISRLAGVLAGHEVRVVGYLRRQDEYVESAYKQAVKGHVRLAKKFSHFADMQLNRGRLDYEEHFLEWEREFPGVAVTVRPYDRERFPERNIVLDFMNIAGIPAADDWAHSGADINISLSAPSAKALAWINGNVPLSAAEHERVVEVLQTLEDPADRKDQALFSRAGRAALMRALEESNERLFRRYCGEANPFPPVEQPAVERPGKREAREGNREDVMLKRIGQVMGALMRRPVENKFPASVEPDAADGRWLEAHLDRGVRGAGSPDDGVMPMPPAEVVKRLNGQEPELALKHGFAFYLRIKAYLAWAGIPLKQAKVLDFGCGWGRHIRFLLRDIPPQNITGSDVDAEVIELCRRQVPGVRFETNGTLPPLAHSDGAFDAVYAQSVFSHLPEHAHVLWLQELLRVLKRGGLLIATTDGPRSFVQKEPALKQIFDDYGYVFVPTRQTKAELGAWGRTAISQSYAERVWGPHLDNLTYCYEPGKYPQAIIVGRKH